MEDLSFAIMFNPSKQNTHILTAHQNHTLLIRLTFFPIQERTNLLSKLIHQLRKLQFMI